MVDVILVTTVSVGCAVVVTCMILVAGFELGAQLRAHFLPESRSWTDDRSEVRS
jgi:hypothetical protein